MKPIDTRLLGAEDFENIKENSIRNLHKEIQYINDRLPYDIILPDTTDNRLYIMGTNYNIRSNITSRLYYRAKNHSKSKRK